MIVEETGKPRTKGGIFVKLLRDATAETIDAEAQAKALARIKREGAEAKKASALAFFSTVGPPELLKDIG